MSEHYHVPLDQLDPALTQHIPPGETILYTTRVDIIKRGMGAHKKSGYLAVTQNGIAFRGGKIGMFQVNIVSLAAGALEGFIPWSSILKFKNYRDKIQIKHTQSSNPNKKLEWFFKAERCKNYGEDKAAFNQRKNGFGPFIENLFKQRK